MEMHRLLVFARRHGRNYIISSPFSLRISYTTEVSFSIYYYKLLRQSFSSYNSYHEEEDFQKVMSVLSNASPPFHLLTNNNNHVLMDKHQKRHQHFLLKVIETSSSQTKLVETSNVPPYNLIRFIKWVWDNNKDFITTPVLDSLVSSILLLRSTNGSDDDRQNDILFLWKLLKHIGHYQSGFLNTRILNKLIQSFSLTMGRRQGKAALEVFNKFEVFQCVPNHDTYYFTLQALLDTRTSRAHHIFYPVISICQNMLLLSHDDDRDDDDDDFQDYSHPDYDDIATSKDFQQVLQLLSYISPISKIHLNLNLIDFTTLRQHKHHFVLKIIETSCQTKSIETPKVSPHNLTLFIKWAWKRNKDLITTPVLESLVSAICTDVTQRRTDILFLWGLLKQIGHDQTGLLNTWILNKLIQSFSLIWGQGKAALDVFNTFEVFQCVPNRDTYTFTLQALLISRSRTIHQAASICQKMLHHPETLLPDDGVILDGLITWFSKTDMIKEAHALYLAVNEKQKTNLIRPKLLLPLDMIKRLCSKEETIHLALEMLNDILEEDVEDWRKGRFCEHVITALCEFKDFDAVKQMILKMIEDSRLPRPCYYVISVIINAYVKAGEIRQLFETLMLLESLGSYTCDGLMTSFSDSDGMLHVKILEEAKKKDYKFIIELVCYTLFVDYYRKRKFDEALKLLTQMKDLGVSNTNLDEYHKLINSLCLNAMDRNMAREQLVEMEPMDREMVEKQLDEMSFMDSDMVGKQLKEMHLNIRALL